MYGKSDRVILPGRTVCKPALYPDVSPRFAVQHWKKACLALITRQPSVLFLQKPEHIAQLEMALDDEEEALQNFLLRCC